MDKRNRQIGKVPRSWIWGATLAVLVLLGLNVEVELARESEAQGATAGPTPISVNRAGELRLRGWVTRSKVTPFGSARVYLNVENRSDKRVGDIRWSLEGESFDKADPILLGDLEPGQAITRSTDLYAANKPGSGIITSLLVWKVGAAQARSTLAIGPVEVRPGRNWGWLLGRSVLAFFKDLALPIVLVLLAYASQHVHQEKTGLQETFHAMLPRAHENIVRFLLPILASTSRFLDRLDQARAEKGPEKELALQQTFFYLLFAGKTMRDLSHKGGGIFFTSVPGESAVQVCWKEISTRMEDKLGAKELSEILDEWGRSESFTALQNRFKSRPATDPARASFVQAERKFKAWVEGDCVYERQLLQALGAVMQYEIDKIYGAWYRTEPEFSEKDLKTLRELSNHGASAKPLQEALKDFADSL